MASKKKKKVAEAAAGAPLWMITYGDMMSLLLCFFILLFSFSTLDIVKFRDVIIELQGAFGVLSGGPMVLNLGDIPASQITENYTSSRQQMQYVQSSVEQKVEEAGKEDAIETSIDSRGLVIRITDTALFDSGRAEIKPGIIPVLGLIAEEIAKVGNEVRVEGHTDPTPISTPEFPSNWELSVRRATAVVHWLIEEGGIDPIRLEAAGFAFYNPIVPNDTPENRAKNRRVDVIILDREAGSETSNPPDILNSLENDDMAGVMTTPPEEVTVELPAAEEVNYLVDPGIIVIQEEILERERVLAFLESPDSDGIVMDPEDDTESESDEE